LTKANQCDNLKTLKHNLENMTQGVPIFQVQYAPDEIRIPREGVTVPPQYLEGKKALAFSGIAQPESFQRTLHDLSVRIVEFVAFPDHHRYRTKELEMLSRRAIALGAEVMLTTEKDLVRCQGLEEGGVPLWGVSIRHVFLGDEWLLFEKFLLAKLNFSQ
jgi:tetraacyldisaccharide 4'-kinase